MASAVAETPTKAVKPKSKRYRWKLMAGTHVEQFETGQVRDKYNERTGEKIGVERQTADRTWHAGDIIETDLNLARLYNSPGSQKVIPADDTPFTVEGIDAEIVRLQAERARLAVQEVEESVPPPSPLASVRGYDTLSVMDLKELRKVAEQNEVDLKGAGTKDEIIKRILDAANS